MDRAHERPALVVADAVRVFGGAERFVIDAARGLSGRGWPVTVLAYPGAPLHHRAREAGLRVHTARTRANGAPWTVLPLAAWMRRERIGAVLSVYDKDLRTACLAARIAGSDVAVVHSRECDERVKDRPWIRWFHTRVADTVVVNSEATRRTTLASAPYLDPERVVLVPKGVDLERFAPVDVNPPDACQTDAAGPIVFGFAGQLVARKRVDALLDALAALSPPWRLRVAGEGPEGASLRARAAKLGIADRVRWDGIVDDMPAWYAAIDALVLPSLVEGWGYVLAEAAAAGRAVVAHRASSVPEVTPESAGALLADPTDPSDLGRRLALLAQEGPAGWRRRGASLQAHARARLGLDRMVADLDTVLLHAVARRRVDGVRARSRR